MDNDTWFIKIASCDCPFGGGQRSMVPFIRWYRERCYHEKHHKQSAISYPKCSKGDCPLKIDGC